MNQKELNSLILKKYIEDVDLSDIDLNGVDFSDCTLKNVRFSKETQIRSSKI